MGSDDLFKRRKAQKTAESNDSDATVRKVRDFLSSAKA
jgi:hypothetical protein